MTEYRSVEDLLVFRDGDYVANLRRIPKGCEFRYTDAFLASNQPPIALHLPKNPDGLRVEGMANLPTYFAGLLPEGVMFSAVKRLIGSATDDLFAVLAATGADAIGDIEVRIPGQHERKSRLTLTKARDQIQSLLGDGSGFDTEFLAAISGAQPKLSLGEIVRASRTADYIAKFDSLEFPHLLENEFAFTRLAKFCRLEVSQTQLRADVLVLKRFDRAYDSVTKRMNKVHVEDMLQVMDLFPNSKYSMEYADILRVIQELGVSKATLLDALRLFVFSYIIGNGDLHAKNVSLIFDKNAAQWRLSPAYDLLSTLPYQNILPGADRMALALADDNFGRFTMEELIGVGTQFGLPERAVSEMIQRTSKLILKNLDKTLQHYISADIAEMIIGRAESLKIK